MAAGAATLEMARPAGPAVSAGMEHRAVVAVQAGPEGMAGPAGPAGLLGTVQALLGYPAVWDTPEMAAPVARAGTVGSDTQGITGRNGGTMDSQAGGVGPAVTAVTAATPAPGQVHRRVGPGEVAARAVLAVLGVKGMRNKLQ
jgi:hypothetical protein